MYPKSKKTDFSCRCVTEKTDVMVLAPVMVLARSAPLEKALARTSLIYTYIIMDSWPSDDDGDEDGGVDDDEESEEEVEHHHHHPW